MYMFMCCINALNCCVHYAFWLGLCVLRTQNYETLFHVVILSKHLNHHNDQGIRRASTDPALWSVVYIYIYIYT
jgi:hypothetical protein